MSLTLRQASPREGLRWVGAGFALFLRRPLGFAALFGVYVFLSLILVAIPYVGAVLLMATVPLLTLAFMLASRSALEGGPVHAGQLIEPLRAFGEAVPRRATVLRLCGLYALLMALLLLLAQQIDGALVERLQLLLGMPERGEAQRTEIDLLLGDPRLRSGLLLRALGVSAVSLPFWHAPALAWWHGQGVAQALFSSLLACWRNRGAFALYLLTWLATITLFGVISGLLFAMLSAPQLAAYAVVPAGLMFSTVFYVSVHYTFEGCFERGADLAPP
jgi:hypothetical protein